MISNFGKKILFWMPSILWMTLIFFFSSKTRLSVSDDFSLNFLFFKTLHVIEYCILTLTYYFALFHPSKSVYENKAYFWLAAVLTLIYAASDEWHQDFVPTREGTPRDVLVDSIGVFLAYRIYARSDMQRFFGLLETTIGKMR